MLPDAPGICIGDLAVSQSPSFNVYFDNIQTDDVVQEYRGVIGQDGELVRVDEFVELCSTFHEVCIIMWMMP